MRALASRSACGTGESFDVAAHVDTPKQRINAKKIALMVKFIHDRVLSCFGSRLQEQVALAFLAAVSGASLPSARRGGRPPDSRGDGGATNESTTSQRGNLRRQVFLRRRGFCRHLQRRRSDAGRR